MSAEHTVESLTFKTEVQQLLHILSHSLYKEREIFLRELISNASDALHRLQFEMLTNREVHDPDAELAIHVDVDEEAKTLTISDSGIGMTHEELVENLGTIAHSGALAFLKTLEEGQRPDDIIGQFGVGFYAVFMVADEVRVTTRSYRPDAQAWTWTSRGDSAYTITPAEKETRGTVVEVQLKEDAAEFASPWRIKQIIKQHSDYVAFPIYVDDEVVNQQQALWQRSPSEITDEEYDDFYRQLTLDFEQPLLHLHIVADVPVDIHSILYVPRGTGHNVLAPKTDYGLKLYSRKVLIQEHNKDMLPEYLRFIEGVVDSADIPLNVARETVQSNRAVGHIKKALRGRIIKALKELGAEKPEDYAIFWESFGIFIKEGVTTDFGGRDDLLPLLRYKTSQSEGRWISLETYVERMSEEQTALYYILGDSEAAVDSSPHLDAFRARGLEVLYMTDPLDALVIQSLREYQGKPFKNVDDPELELPPLEKPEESPEETTSDEALSELIVRFRNVLGDRVSQVRESQVLQDSPCRLVSAASGPENDMQRVRKWLERDYEVPVKILELNRRHPLIHNLAQLIARRPEDPLINPTIEQLFENLLLLDGLHPDPVRMVPRIQTLLTEAVSKAL